LVHFWEIQLGKYFSLSVVKMLAKKMIENWPTPLVSLVAECLVNNMKRQFSDFIKHS
jgi:hypothetical protein